MIERSHVGYLRLYADCMVVHGAKMSAIYDLTRHDIHVFPREYCEVLDGLVDKRIEDGLQGFSNEEDRLRITEFIEYLLEKQLVAVSQSGLKLPSLPLTWHAPSEVQSAIIDIKDYIHDFPSLFRELGKLGCEYVQIRSFNEAFKVRDIPEVCGHAKAAGVRSVELIVRYDQSVSDREIAEAVEASGVISRLIFHSSPEPERLIVRQHDESEELHVLNRSIFFVAERIDSEACCGNISLKTIAPPSSRLFAELQHHNGCLNRKISIDGEGCIRNCPSMAQNYGHVSSDSLSSVARSEEFQRYWHLAKDMLDVCKDCELRYACTDCRAYLSDQNDELSKPAKCGYDPYTGTWRGKGSAKLNGYRERTYIR